MLIFGAGGHAKVIADVMYRAGIACDGFFDDNATQVSWSEAPSYGPYDPNIHPEANIIIAIGNNQARIAISQRITHRLGTVIDTTAHIASGVSIASGTVVLMGVCIQVGAQIGANVIVNTGAIIEHDAQIASGVHCCPGSVICGGAIIGEAATIGPNAVVSKGCRIGTGSVIGAGAVIIRDVPEAVLVAGVPGRIIRRLNPSSAQ
jgi:sugar O-acyltransferase (sialic acid O-acetyltransferase NeuD family)